MTKTHLLILFLLTLYPCNSQTEIHFNPQFQPGYIYTLTSKQVTEHRMEIIGSNQVLDSLKRKGVENPTINKTSGEIISKLNVGETNKTNNPIQIEILNAKEMGLNDGINFSGKLVDGMAKIDSISAFYFTVDEKKALMKAMELLINKIKIPDQIIKVGESYEYEDVASIPIIGKDIEAKINSIYILKNVENETAFFDITQEYDANMIIDGNKVRSRGVGNGHFSYNLENKFINEYYLDLNLTMQTELESFSIEIQSKNVSELMVDIKKASR